MTELNIILPGIIWPESADLEYILGVEKFPHLSQVLSKARVKHHKLMYSDIYYHKHFENHELSLASNYAAKLGLDPMDSYLMVEPTTLRPDRDRLLIAESSLLQLDDSEAYQIIESLNQHFGQDGITFYYINEEFWLVKLPYSVTTLKSFPIIDIIGENIDEYMPGGDNRLKLHSLLNEIQMLLFNHPVNQLREQEGSLIANSVWFWDKKYIQLPFVMNNLISTVAGLGEQFRIDKLTDLADKGATLFIDQAYFPCAYQDSFAWLNVIKDIDNKVVNELISLIKLGKIKQLVFWFNLPEGWVEFRLSKYDLYKFWRRGEYKQLVARLLG